jgi:hypothetical protein
MARADEGTSHSRTEGAVAGRSRSVRRSTETKSALKTTELMVFVAMTAAVLIAALIVDDGGDGGFAARQSWLYATLLAVGYMVSRGLAKSGSRDPYTDDGDR